MPTVVANSPPPPDTHPLAQYLLSQDKSARDLIEEKNRQLRRITDESLSSGEQAQAGADALELEDEIKLLASERNAFLVGVVTGVQPPNQAVVDLSLKLARDLAVVVVNANRPRVMLAIATGYINAARAALTGQVPAAPATAPAAPAPAAPAPAPAQ